MAIVLIVAVPLYRGRARRRRVGVPERIAALDANEQLTANAGQQPSAPPAPEGGIVVLSYPGRTQADAAAAFGQDAQRMASFGCTPVSQSWAEGRPGLARVAAIGIFSTAIRPAGYLTVTYRKQTPESPVDAGKVCPRCAETVKPGALVCRFCGHEFETMA